MRTFFLFLSFTASIGQAKLLHIENDNGYLMLKERYERSSTVPSIGSFARSDTMNDLDPNVYQECLTFNQSNKSNRMSIRRHTFIADKDKGPLFPSRPYKTLAAFRREHINSGGVDETVLREFSTSKVTSSDLGLKVRQPYEYISQYYYSYTLDIRMDAGFVFFKMTFFTHDGKNDPVDQRPVRAIDYGYCWII